MSEVNEYRVEFQIELRLLKQTEFNIPSLHIAVHITSLLTFTYHLLHSKMPFLGQKVAE